MEKLLPPADDTRKTRSDGVQSRERLLLAAMRLFAEQGFAKTSTREIALAAGVNIASISYYFRDKAGLYRAAFTEPAPHTREDIAAFTDPNATLREALAAFYGQLLAPLKQGDLARLCMRLWFREMLEPTGLWHEEIDNGIRPAHAGLMLLLGRHMGIEDTDNDDLARLAFSVVGLALQMMVTREVIDKIRPQLLDTGAAIDTWIARLVDYAEAMVKAEQARLAGASLIKTPLRKKKV
ncbi:MAG: CerR family C-terminal domain-containing protein [Massilia sp.]|nr:CerR family C-terminal domain-containing protein [Massilia sp.]